MRCFPLLLYACAWLFWSTSPALSQVSIDVWTTDNGLPQNTISGLCQAADGYLWLATFDGLARFDGVRFTTFKMADAPGIRSNRFDSILCAANGDLWAATEWSGITRYHNGQFITYTTENGLPSNEVKKVIGDGAGHIWALSGLSIVRWDAARSRFVDSGLGNRNTSVSSPIWLGWLDRGTQSGVGFWGLSRNRIHIFSPGQLVDYPLPRDWPTRGAIAAGEDVNGDLWIGGVDRGLAKLVNGRWSPSTGEIFQYRDSRNNLWDIGLTSGGSERLLQYLAVSANSQRQKITFNDFFEDREGSIWLGTDGQGLYRLRRNVVSVLSQEDGLPDRNIYPIFQDRDGKIWIGTWNKGLVCDDHGKFKTFTTVNGLVSNRITAISEDHDGILWVASDPGLQKMQNDRFEPVRTTLGRGIAVVRAIHEDSEGTRWFGTAEGLFQNKNSAWKLIKAKEGLAGDDVRVIIDGRAGNLWIGGYGGLTRLDHGKFQHWTQADGLPSDTIRCLYEDKDGVLWIGTYDGGLGRLQDGHFTQYTLQSGLFNNGVFQILEDSLENLWMSSNRGIFRVSKHELNEVARGARRTVRSIAFTKSQGLRNAECNGGLWPAGIRARDGKLWFPTQDGVAIIDPEHMETNPRKPPVVIESVLIDGTPSPLDHAICISPGQETLEVQYTALSLLDSEQIQFRYQLAGLDRNWTPSMSRRAAYYSHLPSGEYDFHVIAANSDGVWNQLGARIHVSVLPPFYKTWWFVILVSSMGAGAMYCAWQFRVLQLKRAYAAQEAFSRQLIGSQESERRRIAGELHDSLGQQLLIIKNWATLALSSGVGNDRVKEPLTEISTTASHAIDEVRGIAHNLRPYALEKLDLSSAIQDLIDQVAVTSPIQFTSDLVPVKGVFASEVEVSIYRMIQEALNNIVRHSHASHARVTIRRDAEGIELNIEDDGCGFTPEDGSTGKQGRQGFGLRGIAERVRMLGGRVTIQSTPGAGSTIHIWLRAKEATR